MEYTKVKSVRDIVVAGYKDLGYYDKCNIEVLDFVNEGIHGKAKILIKIIDENIYQIFRK